ncbi:MAG: flavin reductase family protein [Anaerolineales bacterium]|nr:flavin reductase family protein [Anaerolineales bacterium]
MSKVILDSSPHLNHFYPVVAAVVTTHGRERPNALACAWHSALSFSPPLYGVLISKKRYSYELIIEAGGFAVNFLPFEKAEKIAGVGRNSGRDMDKFSVFDLKTEPLTNPLAPILQDAYAAYECRLVERRPYGDHDLFVGEIVRLHLDESAFDKTVLAVGRVHPALYLGADLYTTTVESAPRLLRGK